MTVTNTEIVTPAKIPMGYLIMKQDPTTLVLTAEDGILYPTQQAAMTALVAATANDVADTVYLILHSHVISGVLATVT